MAYKKDDKVICVDANMGGGTPELIQGKTYAVLKIDNMSNLLYVLNEQGKEMAYSRIRFMPAPEVPLKLPKAIARMQMFNLARVLQLSCEVFEIGDNYVFVRFTSDQFKGTDQARRRKVLDHMLQERCARVLEDYTIFYEAFTRDEVLLLGVLQ